MRGCERRSVVDGLSLHGCNVGHKGGHLVLRLLQALAHASQCLDKRGLALCGASLHRRGVLGGLKEGHERSRTVSTDTTVHGHTATASHSQVHSLTQSSTQPRTHRATHTHTATHTYSLGCRCPLLCGLLSAVIEGAAVL